MSSDTFRGVLTIPSTPFKQNGDVDWGDLKRVLDFCITCGAHGIVWPVNASSFPVLTDQERLHGMQMVVEHTAGRVPVILGVQGASGNHAAMFARHAQALEADGVIAMAPYIEPIEDEDAMVRYYQGIDREVDMPIFIQNHTRGSELSIDTVVRLINEVEHIEYVKEETFPPTHMATGLIEQAGPKLKGVFGGASGRYLLLEHPRGVAGQMPGCHITDVVVRLWNALEAGDLKEAKRVYGIMAPLFALETQALEADGVIAMAPYIEPIEDEDAMVRYYQGIDREVDMPIFIQNHTRGSELSIDTVVRLINEVEHIEYVKEETFPPTHMATGLIEQAGPKLKGVFGGASGRYLLLEHPRGVAGQMPGCHITDVVVRLWNALEAGDLKEAKRVYGIMAPLFALETIKGTNYPEILRRRQVIKSSHSRLTTRFPTQDAYDHAALDDILRDLEPLFTWNEKPLLYGPPEWLKDQ